MLKRIDPLLSADLLHALAAMGHGDEIAIVDANFPAASTARTLLRLDGASAGDVLQAVLSLLPLDDFVDQPAAVMAVVGGSDDEPEAVAEFRRIAASAEGHPVAFESMERFAFYDRARRAFAIVATGERRLYGNIIVTKGVIQP